MEKLIGQFLDHYQITKLLDKGGRGAVFEAQDTKLQRKVAVKVITPEITQQPDFQAQFFQQARIAARLEHPGIVSVFDFGRSQSWFYVVMDLIPGESLRQRLRDLRRANQWITLPEALQLVRQVCWAVDYNHRQGVINRDIRPNKIMLKPHSFSGGTGDQLSDRVILIDLGLTKLDEAGQQASSTVLAFMSPEQALGQPTDTRSVIYALGVLLYVLTVGELPQHLTTLAEAARYHTQGAIMRPRSVRPVLPEAVEQIILKAMAKNPVDRFQNAGLLAETLGDVLVSSLELEGPSPQPEQKEELPQKNIDTAPQARREEGRILILSPGGAIRSIPLTTKTLTIGRGSDNDLVLDHSEVSRHHAQIEYDGTTYRVVDLNSTNGTFLAKRELSAGVPMVWKSGQSLRMGDFQLYLERGEQAARGLTPETTTTLTQTTPEIEPVGVVMETNHFSVTPGSSTTASIIIHNQSKERDTFKLSAKGIPVDWVLLPPLVKLLPDQKQEVKLTIQPPRAPQTQAGRYRLMVRVTGQSKPDQFGEVEGTLTVAEYSQFKADIRPKRLQAGQNGQMIVHNQGNAPEKFLAQWRDQTGELTFDPSQLELTVSEDQITSVEFRAGLAQSRWVGGRKVHEFSTRISSEKGKAQTVEGQVMSQALIPTWVPILAAIFLLGLCAGLAFLFVPPAAPQETPVIQSVTIDPPAPVSGQPVTVRWQVNNAERIDLRPLISGLNPEQGEYTFTEGFTTTTPLTLVATNNRGSAEQPLVVNVTQTTPIPTPEPDAPVLEEWFVFPTEVTQGQPVTIRWRVSNAEEVVVEPFGTVNQTGQIEDTPRQTKTYRLIASNQGRTVQRSQEVLVSTPVPQAPRIRQFTVEPTVLVEGQTTTVRLTWETEQADTVIIEPDIGAVSLSGFLEIPAPSVDTVYTLIARNAGDETRLQVRVHIVTPTPTQTPTPSPTPSPTPPPTATNTFTPPPTATFTPVPTATDTPPATPTPSDTPTFTPSPTDLPTATSTTTPEE